MTGKQAKAEGMRLAPARFDSKPSNEDDASIYEEILAN
jgi:hypothetical protein